MAGRAGAASPLDSPRLLFVDAYDSFSNNIISLLRLQLSAEVTTIRIDDSRFVQTDDSAAFHSFLRRFDAVVVGPGPGDPHRSEDIGVIEKLWALPDDCLIPVLGVCLGFQSLVLAFGGSVAQLAEPRHGLVKHLTHSSKSLFAGAGDVHATQYHSWHAQLGHENVEQDAKSTWEPTNKAPDMLPLAWDFSDVLNGPILMATRHLQKPFWGVQYHPESVCTDGAGASIIRTWWREAQTWRLMRRKLHPSLRPKMESDDLDSGYATENVSPSISPIPDTWSPPPKAVQLDFQEPATGLLSNSRESSDSSVSWISLDIPADSDLIPDLSTLIKEVTHQQPMILESGTKKGIPVRSETGRYSVLCFVEDDRTIFQYWTDRRQLEYFIGDELRETISADISQSFNYIKTWTSDRKVVNGPDVPFWGGLVGLISYEAGLESVAVEPVTTAVVGPDLCFASIKRSFVIDHVGNKVYIQSLGVDDNMWLDQMNDRVQQILDRGAAPQASEVTWRSTIDRPESEGYCNKVKACQRHIRAGDSYELCLTERSSVEFHDDPAHPAPTTQQIYQRLRRTNPAPFGAYLSFPDFSIMSSSPERFLSWTRSGVCEFRPIKGTVQKREGVTRETAEAILKTDKEQAENLMIVDLIRHDLNGVVGLSGSSAEAPKLMQVEEYETVYQLVSVIRGQLGTVKADDESEEGKTREIAQHGIDVLKASLPPGSMTGAPKKRSCELLKSIEQRRRGAYSGVLGYLDIGGGGDFSVIIRSVIKDRRGFSIAAGGAVTALSDPMAEWEEMMGKSTAVKI